MANDELEKLLSHREEIDRALLERHSRDLTILFSDIVGSTQFYETHGDIAGLGLVKRHNDLLFPVIAGHGGTVVKTIGDAIMATFTAPLAGVRAAVEMQQTLATAPGDRIRIRIGLHRGRTMVTENDVFGDAVNTAARVAHEAKGDEVLISEALFAALPPGHQLHAEPHARLTLKGKAEPLAVVTVTSEETNFHTPSLGMPSQVLVLQLSHSANGLKVAALEGEDQRTVRPYAEVPLSLEALDALANPISALMHSGGTTAYREKVQACGAELFTRALPAAVQAMLKDTRFEFLQLQLDESLVHIPWELMHDGKGFVALRFAAGRQVSVRMEATAVDAPPSVRRHVLVVSNPSGDLASAAHEGDAVSALLQGGLKGETRHLKGPVKKAQFLEALRGCRLLHFAGHATPGDGAMGGGFQLADGVVTPQEVAHAVGAQAPGLVFANGCHASTNLGWRESARGLTSIASAFLERGTRHVVSPMWAIPDEHALPFALRFYEMALAGAPFGEAVRQSRRALLASTGHPLSFAGYVLYGDPRSAFTLTDLTAAPSLRTRATPGPMAAVQLQSTRAAKTPRRPPLGAVALGVVGLLAVGAAGVWLARTPAATTTAAVPPVAAVPPSPALPAGTPAPTPAAEAPPVRTPHQGPVNVSVLPFKNISGEKELAFLSEGLVESLVTELGSSSGVRLIERGLVDLDIKELEFGQSKYVDPATRAALGKIVGAEVVVLGSYQHVGRTVRASARFVLVETGEVLLALKAEAPDNKLFDLQDDVARQVKGAGATVAKKARP